MSSEQETTQQQEEAPVQKPADPVVNDPELDEDELITPRGTLFFLVGMLTVYIVYWVLTYYEVFIIRGS